jgi:inner membrane protein YidH
MSLVSDTVGTPGRGNARPRGERVRVAAEPDEARDATRRTRLANERTYLAWWRTGLTTLAVSVGAGKIVPELSGGPRWPYELIGVAFAVSGIAFMAYGYVRHKEVDAALSRGDYRGFTDRASIAFALIGAVLGLATILLVLVHPA